MTLAATLSLAFCAFIQNDATSITIYSAAQPGGVQPELYRPSAYANPYSKPKVPGFALVRQDRELEFTKNRSEIRLSDVAAEIDPTTVLFTSLTDPATTRVLEQSFQFDIVDSTRLLDKYRDKKVIVERGVGAAVSSITGILLSPGPGPLIVKTENGTVILQQYNAVHLADSTGELLTKPTLVWDVETAKPGKHQTRVSYQTEGITWWADYNLIFTEGANANAGTVDVAAWVSILNQSGATYPNAKLKLIAGDVNRVQPEMQTWDARRSMSKLQAAGEAGGFEEKSFFEYHLYTLQRPTTIPDRSTRQMELFPSAHGVPCEKVLVYRGIDDSFGSYYSSPMIDREFMAQGNKKINIYLKFKNTKASGMGMPLPTGRMRVSKLDPADGSLEFIGEDSIDHTPKDEPVLIRLGEAFDVVGARTQANFKIDTVRHQIDEDIEISIRNHKAEDVKVFIRESLYRWKNWEIKKSSHEYTKTDSRNIEIPITIPKDGEVKVKFSVHYNW
ncbi:MAG: DUF4139 domain-containing protein [Planctomycetota bacterium]